MTLAQQRQAGRVDLQQAAARAGVSRFLIYLAIERGELRGEGLRGGGWIRTRKECVDGWTNRRR
jgi:hypothetical protein